MTNDLGILHTLVLQGRGIGFLPIHLVAEDVLAGRLKVLLPGVIGLEVEVGALYSAERRQSPLIRALLETLDVFTAGLVEAMADLRPI